MTAARNPNELIVHRWTADREETLRRLWADGWSASMCAAELGGGLTRNSIVGKVSRLKLVSHGKPTTAKPGWVTRKAGRLRAPGQGKEGLSGGLARKLKAAHRRALLGLPKRPIGMRFEKKPLKPQPVLIAPDCQPVTLMDLAPFDCRWPLGEPAGPATLFCGAKGDGITSYCPWHARHAYQPPEQRRRAA